MHILKYLCFVAVLILAALMGPNPEAQGGVAITFPSVVAAGPDYATEVLGDPWDMCNPQDISLNPDQVMGFSSFGFLTGPCRMGGTTAPVNGSADSNIQVLDPGLFEHAINPGRNGRNFPVDSSRYQVLSYKLSSSSSENPQVYWTHNPTAYPGGEGLGGRVMPTISPGAQISIANLTQSPIPGLSAWTSGVVRGFRVDPNSATVGGSVFFHWIRLTTVGGASGTPGSQNISWTGGSGAATVSVTDSEGTVLQVASGATSPFLWHYGTLPPGNYTLTVIRASGSGSRAFRINNPPRIDVTDPSPTTGADYATTVLGNPWDMSDPADVQLTGLDHFTTPTFGGGVMSATNTNDDPIVTLLYNSNNGVPIDVNRFRYFTVRFQIDGPFDLGAGSVGRVFWTSTPNMGGHATTSLPFIVWAGMNSYTIDLTTLVPGIDGGLEPSGDVEPWLSGNKRHFRFDPHEFPQARTFHVDDVKLTAIPAAGATFTIRFAGTDTDGDAATVSLYYDTDPNPNNGKTLIAAGVPQANSQFVWNTSGVPQGDYLIYAESSDGIQAIGRYSTAPVRVIPLAGTPANLRIVPD